MEIILIDTQILIWMALEPEKLSQLAQDAIVDSNHILQLSYVSIWEMAIKIKTGKLNIGYPLVDFIDMAIEKHQLKLLDISLSHIYYTQELELIHRDPFDRIIAAQALVENIQLI